MANILLLDNQEVTHRAMRGILARGEHRFAAVTNTKDAWEFLCDNLKIDLLVLELKLSGENGIAFIERLRSSPFFKNIPVLVYTSVTEKIVVKKALSINIQNYLIKPYNDDRLLSEVLKVEKKDWLALLFEEEKSFCAQMNLMPADLKKLFLKLRKKLDEYIDILKEDISIEDFRESANKYVELKSQAESSGYWGLYDYLCLFDAYKEEENWDEFKNSLDTIELAKSILLSHLRDDYIPDAFSTEQEQEKQYEAAQRAIWDVIDIESQLPILKTKDIEEQILKQVACPVMDSVGATFAMSVGSSANALNGLTDLVRKDAGLAAQMLISANRLDRKDKKSLVVEDPKIALGLLGEKRLKAIAGALPVIREYYLDHPPLNWISYWMYQVGVARVSEFICEYLEIKEYSHLAYWAGLLHDLGRLILIKMYPYGFQAMLDYSRNNKMTLSETEIAFIGCNASEIGDYFSIKFGVPRVYTNVMRWVKKPDKATEDDDIVALVSLARSVCLKNQIGFSGDSVPNDLKLEDTEAWLILKERSYRGFDMKKFEAKLNGICAEIRSDLTGQVAQSIEKKYETLD